MTINLDERAVIGRRDSTETNGQRLHVSISRWLSLSSCVPALLAVLFLVVIVTFEVFVRYFLGSPTSWVSEYSGYLLLVTVFVGAPHVLLSGQNVSTTIVLDRLGPGAAASLRTANAWVVVVVLTVLAWKFLAVVSSEYRSGTRDWGLLATPLWMPQCIIAVGYVWLCLAAITDAFGLSHRQQPSRNLLALTLWAGLALTLGAQALRLISLDLSDLQIAFIASLTVVVMSGAVSGWRPTALLACVLFVAVTLFAGLADSTLGLQMGGFTACLLLLLGMGLPIAFLLGALAVLAALFWLPLPMVEPAAARAWETVNNSTLTAIPMFVLMGAILVRSGISRELFSALRIVGGRVPGSLAHATISASGVFAAVCGSSLATAATIGQVAGPEMIKHGYNRRLAYGVIAAGGTLGILIPPSIAMLLYGSMVGVSVTKLFIAGILPGILLMTMFSLTVLVWIAVKRDAGPHANATNWARKIRALGPTFPFVLLIISVLGSLYLGIATPTEAGAVGAVVALILCAIKGNANWTMVRESLEETALVTGFLLMIAVGASQMSFALDYLGAAVALVEQVQAISLPPWAVLGGIVVIYLILGMFIDPISMMLMTLPVVAPLVQGAGMDLLWFGVVLVLLIELGLVTPPVGMILFVLKGVAVEGTSLEDIAKGVVPFLAVILLVVAILYWQPGIVTWLPRLIE